MTKSNKFTTSLEIKESSVKNAGNGVFTKNSIKNGSKVCYYAGRDETRQSDNTLAASRDDRGVLRFKSVQEYTIPNFMDPYAMESLDDEFVRIGFRQSEGSHGVGQLVNDYCMFDPTKLPLNSNGIFTISSFNKLKDIYIACSLEKANVSFKIDGQKWVLYAYRDIREGEELFLHYGEGYWTNVFFQKSEYPLHKVIAFLEYAIEYVISKNDASCYTFMQMVGIENNGANQRKLGVDPRSSETEKLKSILNVVYKIAC